MITIYTSVEYCSAEGEKPECMDMKNWKTVIFEASILNFVVFIFTRIVKFHLVVSKLRK